jgi:hypothetical protein
VTVRLTRFVYNGGDAHAVYYAAYTDGHPERELSGLLGLGEWGEDGSPSDRVAFPFLIWADQENFNVTLVDATESPWSHVTLLGRIVDRAEALEHRWIKDVFHITDHMVRDDKVIADFFAKPSGGATDVGQGNDELRRGGE